MPVLAIDGPSGSGKGTIARRVAAVLGYHLLDSGALYRLVALAGRQRGLAPDDEPGHAEQARTLDVEFGTDAAGEERILLDGADSSPVRVTPNRRSRDLKNLLNR